MLENKQPKLISGIQHSFQPQTEQLDIKELKGGSTVLNLEAAVAIQVGKLKPFGYDRVAEFFTEEYGRTTPAHNAWFLAEAEAAGRIPELQRDFPEVPRLARYITDHMRQNYPGYVSAIMQRVAQPDYTLNGAKEEQETAGKIFEAMFGKYTR